MHLPGPAPRFPPAAAAAAPEATAHDIAATQLFIDTSGRRAEPAEPPPETAREDYARELIAACAAELSRNPDPARAGRLHYEMARAYESPLDDLERAREHYQAARERLPEHVPTLRGSRRVLIALGRHGDAVPIFDAEARLVSDPVKKAMLFYEKGVLIEDRLRQRKEARRAYLSALELDETNPTILKAFERASTLGSEWDDLDRTFEREANAVSSDPRHRAALVTERARLADARKGNADRAIELYQAALGIEPRAPGPLAALKSLLYAHERFRDLIGVLEHEASQAKDAEARALALYRVGRLYADRLGAIDEAITSLESAATYTPNDPMVLTELARLYEVSKRWGKLSSTLETMAAGTPSPAERVALVHRIAQIAEERLGDGERAIEWQRRALDTDPGYVPALQALGKLYAEQGHWTALIAMHLGEAGAAKDVTRRASAHARVAEILETHLGNTDQAIEHHVRALGLAPGYSPSFKALVRLYSQAGRFRELAELYERAVDQAKDSETKITYLFKIGRIHEDAVAAPLSAVTAYKRILEIDGNHLGAIHALQRAAERGGAWEDLVAALDREAEKVSDRTERAALMHRAAEVSDERLGDVDGALARYKKVLALDPKYAPTLGNLGRLYYRTGRFEDLLATYELELAVTAPGAPAAALLYKMGELCEDHVGRDEEAIKHYRAAVDADPQHLTAIRALIRLQSGRAQWREVVRLLELEGKAIDDPGAHARTAFRIGEVYEHQLDDRARALEAYERALAAAPDFRPAHDGRTRLLERAKDYKKLAEALEKEATESKDPVLALLARFRLGEVLRDHLNEPAKAIDAFKAVLAVDPNHLGALLALEPLYAGLSASDDLSQCLMAQARILENGFAKVAVLRELARLEELRVAASASEVAERYLTIVRVSPADSSALGALERVAIANKNWELLTQVDSKLGALADDAVVAAAHQTRLGEALELRGDPSALDTFRAALARDPENIGAARGLSRLAARTNDPALLGEAAQYVARVLHDPDRAAALLVQSALIRYGRMRDPVSAAADLERALEICPDHADSAARLIEILTATQDLGRLTDLLSHAAGRAKTPARRADLWVTVGGLHADRRNDIGAGLTALERALKEQPGHVGALMKEAELYGRDGRASEAVDRLSRVVAKTTEPSLLLGAHLQLARLLDGEVSQPDKAVGSLKAVLGIDPRHREALAMLLDIETRQDKFKEAAETAAMLVDVCPAGIERADALTRLARLERRRGNVAPALEAYRDAVAITGVDGAALAEMRALFAEIKKRGEKPPWDVYADGLSRYLDHVRENDPRLAPAFLELARVFGDDLNQSDRAIGALRAGVSRFTRDAALRTELAERLRRAGKTAEAAEELRRLVDLDPLRLETWRDLADALKALGRADLGNVAVELLVALGGGTDLERIALEQRVARPASVEPGSFDAETIRLLDAGTLEDQATSRLVACAALGLERIYPPDFEAYGVSRSDRISSRSGHPLRLLADRIARVLGIGDFDFYVHQAHSGEIAVEFSDPVSILVPAHVAGLPDGHQAFLLARILTNVARGLHPVDRLPTESLGEVIAAAMRTVDPSFGSGQGNEDYLETFSKNLYKGLPRRGRRPLEEAAAAYGPSPKPRLEEWALRVRKTATRVALLISDDPAGAVGILRRTEGDLSRADGALRERGMAVIADVLRFAVSDIAATARRRVGLG